MKDWQFNLLCKVMGVDLRFQGEGTFLKWELRWKWYTPHWFLNWIWRQLVWGVHHDLRK